MSTQTKKSFFFFFFFFGLFGKHSLTWSHQNNSKHNTHTHTQEKNPTPYYTLGIPINLLGWTERNRFKGLRIGLWDVSIPKIGYQKYKCVCVCVYTGSAHISSHIFIGICFIVWIVLQMLGLNQEGKKSKTSVSLSFSPFYCTIV